MVSFFYLASAFAYLRLFLNRSNSAAFPSYILIVTQLFHAAELLARGAEAGAAGGAPFSGLSGFISLFSFLLGTVYLFIERRYKLYPLGAFQTPVIFVFHLVSTVIKPDVLSIPPLHTGMLFVLHVVPAIMSYASLTVSFVAAAAFLLLENRIKKKKFGLLMKNLPHLELVEAVNAAGVKIGVLLLVISASVGTFMGYRYLGESYQWDIKNWSTIVIMCVFTLQLFIRRFERFRGKRSVAVSAVGYITVILGLTVVNMSSATLHPFF